MARQPRLLAIGRLKPGPEAALFEHYNARLRPPLVVTELPEARGSAAEIRRREGAALLGALPEGALLVALDLGGHRLAASLDDEEEADEAGPGEEAPVLTACSAPPSRVRTSGVDSGASAGSRSTPPPGSWTIE